MFSKCFSVLVATSFSLSSFASYDNAVKKFGNGNTSREVIVELSNAGYHFSLIPWIKDFIVKSPQKMDQQLEKSIDEVMNTVGVRTFESLPEVILKRVNSPNVKYILAKRYLNELNYANAEKIIEKISSSHPSYPFVKHLSAVILSSQGKHEEAVSEFKDCVKASEKKVGDLNPVQQVQMLQNRDYCLAGISRAYYGMNDFKRADLAYLDIAKESLIWPNILFEEAWNSYQLKNYNRTLGKLVTYKAPVLDFVFNPEVDVLKALSYLKMCLYEDARATADDFYSVNGNSAKELRAFILRNRKNYNYYYKLMANYEVGRESSVSYVNKTLKSIGKDSAYQEIKASLTSAIKEFRLIQNLPASKLKSQLMKNMKVVLDEYKNTLGSYVRSAMVAKYAEFYRAFQDMSYIKLEVLAQRKERLYQNREPNLKRGDVKYIERNDKQYFWNFNGEFWADELGDYVFALRSEC